MASECAHLLACIDEAAEFDPDRIPPEDFKKLELLHDIVESCAVLLEVDTPHQLLETLASVSVAMSALAAVYVGTFGTMPEKR